MRVGELGTVYRHERAGALHGTLRVRGFTQDDAHIFCTSDQIKDEVKGVLDLTFDLLTAFGFSKFSINLSTKPEKSVGSEEEWSIAENSLRETLESMDLVYQVDDGGGAFYGPKIDINIEDAIGRSWQCTTIQFDFNLPERFGITYIGEDGQSHKPYMVHRAIFGSLERFMGMLIEHYGGAFPVWLSPVQAILIPIADRHYDYSNKILEHLHENNIRAEIDTSRDRMNAKIRNAQIQKIPYMLIVGDREMESNTIGVRVRPGEDIGALGLNEMLMHIKDAISDKI
jgi:threonyl-tRNA synthetase